MHSELKQKLNDILGEPSHVDEILQAIKDEGYIHIPTSKGRSTVVHSFDSEDERVMTFEEWKEQALDEGWKQPE